MEITPNRIIWHHSADNYNNPQFDKINQYHRGRSFPISSLGFFVGYHYLIEADGTIKQARKETEIGAHDAGENYGSIGICLAGHFNYTKPTEKQAEAAAKLTDEILKRWKIPLARIEPHRWGDNTDCPGLLLSDYWLTLNYIQRKISWIRRLILELQGQMPK